MKTLTLDIETSPLVVHAWGLFDQNIGLNQIVEPTRMICFAAKWLDSKGTLFYSEHKHGKEVMVQAAHDLLSEADVLIHFNGRSFDLPHLRREFLEQGLLPPAPFEDIDLLLQARRLGRWPSNKLAYLTKALNVSEKMSNEGHGLWVKCMAGDEKAWKMMERYNRQDIKSTEALYLRLKPWLKTPNVALYLDETNPVCPACGGSSLQRRGWAFTTISAFPRYCCNDCGKWSRGGKRERGATLR
jgi:hypothetical protein